MSTPIWPPNTQAGRDLHAALVTLVNERDQLRARVADWENAAQQGHPDPCTFGPLCPYCEIERQRARVAELELENAKAWRHIEELESMTFRAAQCLLNDSDDTRISNALAILSHEP